MRAVADDELLLVPSPTFMLLQAYEEHAGPCALRVAQLRCGATSTTFALLTCPLCFARTLQHQTRPVHHYDLYRLRGPEDMRNLELADSFTRGAWWSLYERAALRACKLLFRPPC